MIQFEQEIIVQSQPEPIFAIYEDVANWHQWDPDVTEAALMGAFVEGASIQLHPRQGPKVQVKLISVTKNYAFTSETTFPLCKMRFAHELLPQAGATRIIHRITFTGSLSFLFGRLVGNQIRKGLPHALTGLKRRAEA